MELTIGILSYNTINLTRHCMQSIYKYTKGINFEIIVVDNASSDGSAKMIKSEFPDVKLIVNKQNKFFAKGYNQIIKIAKGEYFIMLNSDTYLKDNAFLKMLNFVKKNEISACEGLEIKPDGNIISTGSKFRTLLSDFYELSLLGRLFKNKKYVNRIRMKNYNRKKTFEVDVGCNAYFCMITNLLKDIGGFDNNFILYYTEDDISKRIKEKGHKIFHYGNSYVMHEDAKSAMQLGNKRVKIFHKDLLTYHKKYSNVILAYLLYSLLSVEDAFLKLRLDVVK